MPPGRAPVVPTSTTGKAPPRNEDAAAKASKAAKPRSKDVAAFIDFDEAPSGMDLGELLRQELNVPKEAVNPKKAEPFNTRNTAEA